MSSYTANRPGNNSSWLSTGNQFRYNPLTGAMVQVSTERLLRAWGGEVSSPPSETVPEYAAECPFCPGNKRANGSSSPQDPALYPYYFVNDTRALSPQTKATPKLGHEDSSGLFRVMLAFGECEVVIHHPAHNLTLASMPPEHAVRVFSLWTQRYRELGSRPYINYVNIFENFLFGSSQRHPHNQIWASSTVSPVQQAILDNCAKYRLQNHESMIPEIARLELYYRERVVFENSDFVGIVPFWAEWPFEMMILPKKQKNSLADLNQTELENFADAYRTAINKLNALFGNDCPYSSGLYQAPTDNQPHDEGMFFAMFRPPVLRNIRTMKWMVGYELMAMPQRDLTPEAAAFLLRNPQGWEEFKARYMHRK